uniref:BTB domain-containing protein n=1 Tax=Mola mola TaxID=94237 RepID=A0A3Q3XA61_MOLML
MSYRLTASELKSEYIKLCVDGLFTDAVIKVEDVQFEIHKVILCNCSPYFQALFSWCPCPDKNPFEILDLSPDVMQLIIEFAYTGTVSVTGGNVQELLLAADKLLVMAIVDTCCNFLEEQLCPENCIGIWQFTNFLLCPQLQLKAYQFILDKFQQVLCTEEFWQLSVKELCAILDRDELNVRKESTAFEAIHRWIAHAPETRQKNMVLLLSKVRLALISSEYIIMNVLSNELVKSSPECLQMAKDALRVKAWMRRNNPPLSAVSDPVGRPRLPEAILLAFGGETGSEPTNCIEAYDVHSNRWVNVTDNRERPRAHHGVVFLNGCVYCLGGTNHVENFNSVHRFNPSTRTWHEAAPMYFRRCYVSVTVLNGYIYALGGYNGYYRHNTAERYRPETNQWSLIAPMHERRSHASCTALNNKVGDGKDGVIAYANHVYIGGFDGSTRLHSAEAYNPGTNTWHTVSSMLYSRSNFGIGVIDGQLFVVGGFNGLDATSDVEYYDVNTNEWSVSCSLEFRRSALSCCLVSGLPNMDEYTVPRDALPRLLEKELKLSLSTETSYS